MFLFQRRMKRRSVRAPISRRSNKSHHQLTRSTVGVFRDPGPDVFVRQAENRNEAIGVQRHGGAPYHLIYATIFYG